MAHRVTLIPGDGIGPELAEATRRVLDASGVEFEWEVVDAGEAVMAEYGTPLPEHVLDSVRRNTVALKGPITTPVGEGFRSVNVTLRQVLGLYANVRRKVTAVHKANIMKLSDGLFLDSARTVAGEYEGRIEFEDRIVDNMCMQLVQKPDQYDVLVLPNLYGDIVSDLAAGLVGGLGVAPGANIGTEAAVFEPVHGSAPKYAGQDKANPTAMILSGALMLRHMGYPEDAARLETAVRQVIAEGTATTYDLGGSTGTAAFADAIAD